MRKQRGTLSLQFLFGFLIMIAFMLGFGAFSLVLALSEVTQYITFSASRQLFLGHQDEESQKQMAKNKFRELHESPVLRVFYSGPKPFVMISEQLEEGNGLGVHPEYHSKGVEVNFFYGVWTAFNAKILQLRLPFLGETSGDDPNFFSSNIGSYIGREVSVRECREQVKKRWDWILELHENILPSVDKNKTRASYNQLIARLSDNGC